MKKFLIAFVACMSVLVLTTAITLSQENKVYNYAYLAQNGDDFPILYLVDPLTLAFTNVIIPFDGIVFTVTASPNGEWIALLPEYGDGTSVVVYHLPSGMIQSIPAITAFRGETEADLGKQHYIQWAPDGLRFAYIAYELDKQDVFVHNITDQTTFNITSNNKRPMTLQWSQNSQLLAVASETCGEWTCTDSIEIYDASSNNIMAALSLTQEMSGGEICNMKLSPDNRYIVYVNACINSYYAAEKEIYIGELQTQTIIPLTNFTEVGIPMSDDPSFPFVSRYGQYAPFWIDNDTLYVGSAVRTNQTASTQGWVTRYEFAHSTSQTTILNKTAFEWAYASSLNTIAYLSMTDSFTPTDAQVQISTILDGNFTDTMSYPPGCNLVWSPDTSMLAYTQQGTTHQGCRNRWISGLYFIDTVQNTVNLVDIPNPSRTIPIGWVRVTGDNSPIRLK